MEKLAVKQQYKNPRPGQLQDVRASPQSAEDIPTMNARGRKILKWKEERKERKKERNKLMKLELKANDIKKYPNKLFNKVPRKEIVIKNLNISKTPTDDPLYGDNDDFISCNKLHYLLQKSSRYLIIDTRQKIHYDKSRILSDQCINIPQSEIKPGMWGFHFLKYCQDKHSHELYTHRSECYVDIVILLDWDTTQESLTSTTGLHVLKDTLKNRDPGTKYKKIEILNGGYKEWLQRYPAFATNPPNVDNQITESKNIENEILETIDVDEEMDKDDSPRRSVSKKKNKTPVKSSKKSLLKSSQKDVNKYMTPNKGNITQMENTILVENVDKKRRSSRKSVAFSEACVACAENKPVLPMTPHSKRNRSKTPSRQSRSKHAFNEDLIAWNTPEPLPNRVTRSHPKN